jgi:hypothetical protein
MPKGKIKPRTKAVIKLLEEMTIEERELIREKLDDLEKNS